MLTNGGLPTPGGETNQSHVGHVVGGLAQSISKIRACKLALELGF